MKKLSLILIIFVMFVPVNVMAKEKVKLSSCVDGDTAKFILNKKEITVRFLAINSPEVGKNEEAYGVEASNYTCNKLKNAKKIELEYEKNSDKKDKYDRYLAYVFYDDKLLEEELLKKGYAKVAYIYGDYKYIERIKKAEEYAKNNKKGIYSDIDNSKYTNNKSLSDRIESRFKKFINKLKSNISDLFSDILDEIL